MKIIGTFLLVIGIVLAIISVVRYVMQIFKMPTEKRADFKNLIMPKGSIWKHGNNILFLIGVVLLIAGLIMVG
ncbi:hypothetical protein ACFQ4L_03410 [Lapidilactobacillus mulanensis]|uniref:Uncharacterized protein n=1 Tax=Lapidilactobacillus mulanensis TaxID=2485999 RepID=A0ABW4DMX6_9LACO|nr:hypothetical protein [Lapidilactobacillus mulanensis]